MPHLNPSHAPLAPPGADLADIEIRPAMPADTEGVSRLLARSYRALLAPDYDPALLHGLKGVDLNTPLPTLWPQFMGLGRMPLMALRGEHSSLLSEKTLVDMKARVPSLQTVTIPGHGHAPILHLSGIPEILTRFFASVDKTRKH